MKLFTRDGHSECFRNLAAGHRTLADVKGADLRRERRCAIVTDFLVTNSTLGLLLQREFERRIHVSRLMSSWIARSGRRSTARAICAPWFAPPQKRWPQR